MATAKTAPVLVVVGPEAPQAKRDRLLDAGCGVLVCEQKGSGLDLRSLLDELGRRRMTNVLVEGGGRLAGSLLDEGEIDEVMVFIAPKLVGGAVAKGAIAGLGVESMADAVLLDNTEWQRIGPDLCLHARICRPD